MAYLTPALSACLDRTYYASWSTPYMFTEVTEDQLEPIPPRDH